MVNQLLKIFRKSKFVLYVQILDKVFFFAFFLVLARMLSVREYGDIVIIFSVSNIFLYILQFGLPVFFQRQTAKENSIDKSNLATAVIYGVISFILSTALILFSASWFYNNNQYLLIIIIHSFVYSYFFISIFNSFLLGKGEQRIQFLTYLIVRLLTIVLIVGCFYFLMNIILLSIICFLGNLAIALVFYFYLFTNHIEKEKKIEISFISVKYLFLISLPIGIAAISNFLYDKIDVILISKIIDAEQVAYYNISYGIFKASQILFSFILVTGFSRVSALSARLPAVKLFLKKYSLYISIISAIIFITTLFMSKTIILFVYGEKYLSSVVLLQLLSFAIIPLALNNLTGITLNSLGMFKQNLIVVLSALLINVLLNVILLNKVGIIGAVYSTVLTEVFILAFDLIFLKKKLR